MTKSDFNFKYGDAEDKEIEMNQVGAADEDKKIVAENDKTVNGNSSDVM